LAIKNVIVNYHVKITNALLRLNAVVFFLGYSRNRMLGLQLYQKRITPVSLLSIMASFYHFVTRKSES